MKAQATRGPSAEVARIGGDDCVCGQNAAQSGNDATRMHSRAVPGLRIDDRRRLVRRAIGCIVGRALVERSRLECSVAQDPLR